MSANARKDHLSIGSSMEGTWDYHSPPMNFTRSIYSGGQLQTTSRPRSVPHIGPNLRHGSWSNTLPGVVPVTQDKRLSITRVNSASYLTHHGQGLGRYGATPGYAFGQYKTPPSGRDRMTVTIQSVDGRAQLYASPLRVDAEGDGGLWHRGEVREDKFKPWRDQPFQRAG